jgi:hypothetical protein
MGRLLVDVLEWWAAVKSQQTQGQRGHRFQFCPSVAVYGKTENTRKVGINGLINITLLLITKVGQRK